MEGATPGGARSKSFTSAREAMASPLAKRLFQIDGVTQASLKGEGGWGGGGESIFLFRDPPLGFEMTPHHRLQVGITESAGAGRAGGATWLQGQPGFRLYLRRRLLTLHARPLPPHPPARRPQVFFGSDFVTVTKSEDYGWAVLKPDVFAALTEFYAAGEPLFYDEAAPGAAEHIITEDDDEASGPCRGACNAQQCAGLCGGASAVVGPWRRSFVRARLRTPGRVAPLLWILLAARVRCAIDAPCAGPPSCRPQIVAMIKELLETRIRPAVQEDGGDIVFRSWDPDSGVVTLKMMGACRWEPLLWGPSLLAPAGRRRGTRLAPRLLPCRGCATSRVHQWRLCLTALWQGAAFHGVFKPVLACQTWRPALTANNPPSLFPPRSGCPSSAVTLKSGIENMLMHYIPEVGRAACSLPLLFLLLPCGCLLVHAPMPAAELVGVWMRASTAVAWWPEPIVACRRPLRRRCGAWWRQSRMSTRTRASRPSTSWSSTCRREHTGSALPRQPAKRLAPRPTSRPVPTQQLPVLFPAPMLCFSVLPLPCSAFPASCLPCQRTTCTLLSHSLLLGC